MTNTAEATALTFSHQGPISTAVAGAYYFIATASRLFVITESGVSSSSAVATRREAITRAKSLAEMVR
ncbi:hypothetical protein PP301_gp071 [Gordonia phage GMA2]|uniref:Uncharacterized protein n=1 Tax=Gordonia phage GMA2 TaxID=1647283 RepID=A0A0K0N7K1_9CAUD|nr:hypothetical protein PP301_gp071 [Gordonia phage GMA2]AKJ72651.1 hypothetical protein GMA2_113 [Gordonia phage GMA2]